ncbi:uncharacterized protein isoform X6 [Castor canadensis]|uniref:Uncharacterized protein isoform X6 n=2 Tax=Castor canadensis TaxID=51338 RepID=A0AC58LQ89_CASCN
MDWGTVITGTCVSPDSSNWPQGMLHRKRRSSFPLQRFVIVRRLLFRSRRRRPGAPTMHLKWVAAPRHWMRDKLTDVFMSSVLKKTGEHVCLFGDSKGHFCSSPHRSTRGKGGCFWTDCSSCSPLQDSMLQNRRRLQSWNEVDVVSLRGHGGWSAGFQSHERAFSCTSIENILLCRPGWDTTKPSVLLRLSYDKVPDRNNLQEERFILAHGFRDFGPWSPGPIVACLR